MVLIAVCAVVVLVLCLIILFVCSFSRHKSIDDNSDDVISEGVEYTKIPRR